MKEETSKRIHHLHNIVLSMMMNLDDCIEDTEDFIDNMLLNKMIHY